MLPLPSCKKTLIDFSIVREVEGGGIIDEDVKNELGSKDNAKSQEGTDLIAIVQHV